MNQTPSQNQLLEPGTILEYVQVNYALDEPLSCEFIRRGFNDHYRIRAKHVDYIFRVYLEGKYYVRDEGDFLFELELLEYLNSRGVPVAPPIRQRNNDTLGQIGTRSTVLFPHAPGRAMRWGQPMTTAQCFNLGTAMAAMHLAANDFRSAHHRYSLDLEYLVHKPLEMIEKYGTEEYHNELSVLGPLEELIDALQHMTRGGDGFGLIHGDLHHGNMHFTENNQVTFFDFDHCAFGWRAYDLWLVGYLSEPEANALLQGYEALRPLTPEERSSLPVFARLRGLWDMGDGLAVRVLTEGATQNTDHSP